MRTLIYTAETDGSVEENLRNEKYSSALITNLRKEKGLIAAADTDRPLKTSDMLKKGDKYRINLIDRPKCVPKYDIELNFVYEDEDIAVIDKQSNLAVISSNLHYAKSLENALANVWGDFVYRPVNRLDKDTSGLIIIAKNQLAHSLLQKQKIKKKYTALVEGSLTGEGVINAPIYKPEIGSMKRIVDSRGKEAVTKYKSLAVYDSFSKIEFELLTGRTHQIRVHSAYISHPLCCDFLYNPNCAPILAPSEIFLNRQALHSSYLEFLQPVTGEILIFTSKADFE